MRLPKFLWPILPSFLMSCSLVPLDDYAQTQPKLDLFSFFEGKTMAWGQFQTRNGELKRRFKVDIFGEVADSAKGKQLILNERFFYDDGETQQRVWTITQVAPNRFEGQADDVIGLAQGAASGSVFNWRYTLDLPYKESRIPVQFDDWMFMQDEQTLINRAEVTKFGFKVGEVTLFFRKESPL